MQAAEHTNQAQPAWLDSSHNKQACTHPLYMTLTVQVMTLEGFSQYYNYASYSCSLLNLQSPYMYIAPPQLINSVFCLLHALHSPTQVITNIIQCKHASPSHTCSLDIMPDFSSGRLPSMYPVWTPATIPVRAVQLLMCTVISYGS